LCLPYDNILLLPEEQLGNIEAFHLIINEKDRDEFPIILHITVQSVGELKNIFIMRLQSLSSSHRETVNTAPVRKKILTPQKPGCTLPAV
jgi:hypothetical protein